MSYNFQSKTFYWALTGIFAAVHLVMTMLPLFVLVSGGGFISLGLVSSVLVGFLLGPFYGTISILMGSILGVVIFNIGGILGPIIPVIAPVTGALIAGCLKVGRYRIVLGMFIVGIIAYLVSPIGMIATLYLWMHTIAIVIVLLLSIDRPPGWLKSKMELRNDNLEWNFRPIWLISFIALLGDNLIGGAAGVYWFIYGLSFNATELSLAFIAAAVLYPLERIAVSIVVAAIILALMRALKGTQLSELLGLSSKSFLAEPIHRDEAS